MVERVVCSDSNLQPLSDVVRLKLHGRNSRSQLCRKQNDTNVNRSSCESKSLPWTAQMHSLCIVCLSAFALAQLCRSCG